MTELIKFGKKLRVLVVEDNNEAREQVSKLLGNFFENITTAVDGVDGLNKFKTQKFDLIVSDINMPNMNGIDMISEIRTLDDNIHIIILSAYDNSEYFMKTIALGIDSYIIKPIEFDLFVNTITKIIKKIKLVYDNDEYKKELENMNHLLENQITQRIKEIIALNKDIKDTQKEVLFTIGAIGEIRSKETGDHVKRVAQYSKLLALYYGLGEEDAEMLKEASPMHDIGKVGIPDAILNKPAKFTDDEYEIMKKHSKLGYEMLKNSHRPILKLAATIAYQHHERYDGKGYPQGLKGEDIDINGRITALADVFDALGSSRVYKKAWSDEKIFKMLKDERGKHFDPKLIDIFFDNLEEFLKIRDSFKDDKLCEKDF